MNDTSPRSLGPDYRVWQRGRAVVGVRTLHVATKPGLMAHGHADPATAMLADALTDCAGQRVVSMPCGNGLVGAVAAASGASQVWMTDCNGIAIDASRRTLQANAVDGEVRLGHGAAPLPVDLLADVVAIRVVPERIKRGDRKAHRGAAQGDEGRDERACRAGAQKS